MTRAEKGLHADLRDMGCCVCRFVFCHEDTPADIHHILSGSKRKGETWVIPLCPQMHRQGSKDYPSIHSVNGKHGGRQAFVDAYGYTEHELLAMCEKWLGYEYSKGAL